MKSLIIQYILKNVHTEPIHLLIHVKEHLLKKLTKNSNKTMETHLISLHPRVYNKILT